MGVQVFISTFVTPAFVGRQCSGSRSGRSKCGEGVDLDTMVKENKPLPAVRISTRLSFIQGIALISLSLRNFLESDKWTIH